MLAGKFRKLGIFGLLSLFLLNILGSTLFKTETACADDVVVTPSKMIVFKLKDYGYYVQDLNTNQVTRVVMDVPPMIYNNRTFVPVRFLANALGAADENIKWDEKNRIATIQGRNRIELKIGSKIMKKNGSNVQMDVSPRIESGRTMLPARYVAEGLGYKVDWDGGKGYVIIYPEGMSRPSLTEINKAADIPLIDLSSGLTDEAIRAIQIQLERRFEGSEYHRKYFVKWGSFEVIDENGNPRNMFIQCSKLVRKDFPNAMISPMLTTQYGRLEDGGIKETEWFFVVPTSTPGKYKLGEVANFGLTPDINLKKNVYFVEYQLAYYIINGKIYHINEVEK